MATQRQLLSERLRLTESEYATLEAKKEDVEAEMYRVEQILAQLENELEELLEEGADEPSD